MNTLEKQLKSLSSVTYTENGDIAYLTTGDRNLDFFASCGSLRHDQNEVAKKMTLAMFEKEELAILNMIRLRDIRGGLGERDSFRTAYATYFMKEPDKALKLLPAVVEYGRWDDILFLLEEEKARRAVSDFIAGQLADDIEAMKEGKSVSLCAKWMPSINASSEKTKSYARILMKELGLREKEYRKMLSVLREYIDILERHLSAKDYSFDYAKLPTKALMKHTKAFMRNDSERYNAFRQSLQKGEVQTKTHAVYPYEIVALRDTVLREAMWKDLERHVGDCRTIVVRDGSGSMTWNAYSRSSVRPLDIATSLAILFSEQLSGTFRNKFITFSSRPEFVDLSACRTLEEKLLVCSRYNDCSNTDIMRTYQLILEAEKRCDPKDYLEKIVIISDMQFDRGTANVPTYDDAKEMFDKAGIPMPQIVYWNVASRADFPTNSLENVRLVSGSSQYIVEGILKDESIDAIGFMKKELEKYKPVLKLLH